MNNLPKSPRSKNTSTTTSKKCKFITDQPEYNNGYWEIKVGGLTFPSKTAFRQLVVIPTSLEIKVSKGYHLMFQLDNQWVKRGMIVANSPSCFTSGHIEIPLLNCGHEIVEISNGDVLGKCWASAL